MQEENRNPEEKKPGNESEALSQAELRLFQIEREKRWRNAAQQEKDPAMRAFMEKIAKMDVSNL